MIYYVEDDSSIRELVIYTLQTTGFEAKGFENGKELFDALKTRAFPKLILLDIMLPGEDGLVLLNRLKTAFPDIPIIMVTAKNSEYDKVKGLDSGADDYISKPFGMMELVARIKAVIRRAEKASGKSLESIYRCGKIVLDDESHIVTADNTAVELTLKEYELLKTLMKNAGRVVTRDMLLVNIWGYENIGETRTVDVHVRTLRQKLGSCSEIIKTVRGVGYKIQINGDVI